MGGTLTEFGGRARFRVAGVALLVALFAAVLPVPQADAADGSDGALALELGPEPECNWLLTRLIDVNRCAAAGVSLLDESQNPDPIQAERTPIAAPQQLQETPTDTSTEPVDSEPADPVEATADEDLETECPTWSVDGAFADPDGDWDGDTVTNLVELYNGLNPCEPDELPAFEFTPFDPTPQPAAAAVASTPSTATQAAPDNAPENVADEAAAETPSAPPAPDCPVYSVADVEADPLGDWDSDRQTNLDELYNNSNPCIADADATPTTGDSEFVTAQGPCPSYSLDAVLADPDGDWDGDQATNVDEFYANDNPCEFDGDASPTLVSDRNLPVGGPCPDFSFDDVMADPAGDWDGDQITNSDEFYNNSRPCTFDDTTSGNTPQIGSATGPCPEFTLDDVLNDQTGDWDGDTATNIDEFYNNANPCEFDADSAEAPETAEEEALRLLNEALNGSNTDVSTGDDVTVEPELVVTPEDGSDVDVVVDNENGVDDDDDSQVTVDVGDPNAPAVQDEWLGSFAQLQVTDLIDGSGATAAAGSVLAVRYVGVLGSDGRQFDSSYSRGSQTFDFTLGQGTVIAGWDEGLVGMQVGGRRLLQIPAAKAYGAQSRGTIIGPNADLVFIVDLVRIVGAPEPWTVGISGAASLNVNADDTVTLGGQSRSLQGVSEIIVEGADGADQLTVSFDGNLTVPLSFAGGGGTDSLLVAGTTAQWTLTGDGVGSVAGITFTGVEHRVGAADLNDSFTFANLDSVTGLIEGGAGGNDDGAGLDGRLATRAAGLKSQFGTMGKPLNAGFAAEIGVTSTLLAEGGMTSASGALEDAQGFGPTHAGSANVHAFDSLGETWLFPGISYKFHACCHGLHAMLEALRVLGEGGIDPDTVETVLISTHPRWLAVCNQPEPIDGLAAKFSYRLTAAMSLAGIDTAALDSYVTETCVRPDVVAFRDRVTVITDDGLSDTEACVAITIGGQVHEASHDLATPMEAEVLDARLAAKSEALIGASSAADLRETVTTLDGTSSLSGLARIVGIA